MLTLDEQSLCEGKLTLQECWEALTSMQNGKALETMVLRTNSVWPLLVS